MDPDDLARIYEEELYREWEKEHKAAVDAHKDEEEIEIPAPFDLGAMELPRGAEVLDHAKVGDRVVCLVELPGGKFTVYRYSPASDTTFGKVYTSLGLAKKAYQIRVKDLPVAEESDKPVAPWNGKPVTIAVDQNGDLVTEPKPEPPKAPGWGRFA